MMRSPEQQFNFAKRLPVQELARVLQGQSDVVDMSIAEMVLRQKMQMQKAQQGAAAVPMAQGPKVVEKDLAQAGVAAMPAPNLENVDSYAGGGIVAFDDGGKVVRAFDGLYIGGGKGPQLPRPTEEEMEARRLRDQLRRFYQGSVFGFRPSFGGNIAAEREEYAAKRATADAILSNLDKLDIESLRNLAAEARTTATPTATPAMATTPAAINAPEITRGDLRKLEKGEGAPSVPATAPSYIPRAMNLADINKAPAASSISALMNRAEEALQPKGIKIPTATEDIAAQKEYLTAAGYDPKFFEKQKSVIEKQRGEIGADKEQAGWFRALEAGLGILGGESPYAFVNIGKGASPALKGLQEDIRDIKKLNREYDKAIRDIDVAQQTDNRELGLAALKRAQDRKDKIEDRKFELAKTMFTVEAQERIASMPGQTERIIKGLQNPEFAALAERYYRMQGPGARVDSAILQEYAKNPMKLEMLKQSDPALYNYIKAQLATLSVPSTTTTPTGSVRD